jgi:hypothetical protein
MGVMACDRPGCERILCDNIIDGNTTKMDVHDFLKGEMA